ncbi:MAG: flavin reductase family protein [Alphaproteobacteria bacterium]|nr:flavin reductase family protein [Alphaproteobacteria bacterium]
MSIDPRTFRDAMGRFATGIALVSTISRAGEPLGLTINSFSSVSLDPPLVLFSLARTASRFEDFIAAGRFAVNVLCTAHRAVSQKFARHGEGLWGELPRESWTTGCPILPGALASFDCTTEARYEGGDHVIMLGRVQQVCFAADGEPLLYFCSAYRAVSGPLSG